MGQDAGHLCAGDVVTVPLDRLARTRDLLDVAERIESTGAGRRSLAEPWADTTLSGKFQRHATGALATQAQQSQFIVGLIRDDNVLHLIGTYLC